VDRPRTSVDLLSLFLFQALMDLIFRVVEADISGDTIIATAANFLVARAAFDTAVSLWPNRQIELVQGEQVLLKSVGYSVA